MKCDIIRDLLPLYCDGLCSEASRQEIEAHVAQCEECRACLVEMKEEETRKLRIRLYNLKSLKKKGGKNL